VAHAADPVSTAGGRTLPQSPRTFHLAAAGPYFAGLLLLALITFWPTYVSLPPSANNLYTHFHAMVATLWVLLLIAQPMLLRAGRMRTHRALGKVSWVLAPVFLIAVVLLASSRIKGLEGSAYDTQTFILWLQISLSCVFALSYALAMAWRKSMVHHARFMICTGLTLIDPVVIRLLFWIDNTPDWNYWWLTFGLTDLVLVGLIWIERNASRGRGVFPAMLAVFVLAQIPALLGLTGQAWWQGFARWFAGLPLT
jgi:uncharacterized membrane protein YozB (DUF420 family)